MRKKLALLSIVAASLSGKGTSKKCFDAETCAVLTSTDANFQEKFQMCLSQWNAKLRAYGIPLEYACENGKLVPRPAALTEIVQEKQETKQTFTIKVRPFTHVPRRTFQKFCKVQRPPRLEISNLFDRPHQTFKNKELRSFFF